jgi:hypothetical protein
MTGSMSKKKSHIHRSALTSDYYLIQLHEAEFQASIRTKGMLCDSIILYNTFKTFCTSHCNTSSSLAYTDHNDLASSLASQVFFNPEKLTCNQGYVRCYRIN